jgi:putative ABC transport system substrate-binding protein
MRRRDFIAAFGGAAATWPLAARAQQPVIGFLSSASPEPFTPMLAAFREGLGEMGYVEHQNLSIEYRWADGRFDRLQALAADLVRDKVNLIAAGGVPAAVTAKAATTTIPIVFNVGGDPIKLGLVTSINRPGGNATGINFLVNELIAKQFELLHEVVRDADVIAVLVNPGNADAETQLKDVDAAAQTTKLRIVVLKAGTASEIDAAFVSLAKHRANALVVGGDAFLTSRREQIVALATRYALPMVSPFRETVAAGALISYGASLTDAYRQFGSYAGKVLGGANAAELPVVQPTKFELTVNLKTAKALGLTIPGTVLARADEVIE